MWPFGVSYKLGTFCSRCALIISALPYPTNPISYRIGVCTDRAGYLTKRVPTSQSTKRPISRRITAMLIAPFGGYQKVYIKPFYSTIPTIWEISTIPCLSSIIQNRDLSRSKEVSFASDRPTMHVPYAAHTRRPEYEMVLANWLSRDTHRAMYPAGGDLPANSIRIISALRYIPTNPFLHTG